MCGRYVQRTPLQYVMELFSAVPGKDGLHLVPRFNIAPSQDVPVVRNDVTGKPTLDMLRWGLVPPWAKNVAIGNRLINARVETAAKKPLFCHALHQRRCLIPANGFYEWKKTGRQKQPWYFHRADDAPIAFSGLWERWSQDGHQVDSCTILTTAANPVVRPVHGRMPLILDRSEFRRWLDNQTPLSEPFEVTQFKTEDELVATAVGNLVGNVQNDGPQLIEPKEFSDQVVQPTLFG